MLTADSWTRWSYSTLRSVVHQFMYILYIHEYMEDRLEELSNEHCFSDKPCETLDSEEGKNEMNDVLAKMMS